MVDMDKLGGKKEKKKEKKEYQIPLEKTNKKIKILERNEKRISSHINLADVKIDEAIDDAELEIDVLLEEVNLAIEEDEKSAELITYRVGNYMEEFLIETPSINYMDPVIQEKFQELKNQSEDQLDYIKLCYLFVRDAIPHSWDIETDIVSRTASEVLENKTGICWTKSCLLAALLRADGIPSGISYQLLTRADDDSEGYMIHALNTVYIKDLNKWIRLDARGNKENIYACFSLDEECLAYSVRSEFGEIDYHDNHADLDERLVHILNECESILEISTDFEF